MVVFMCGLRQAKKKCLQTCARSSSDHSVVSNDSDVQADLGLFFTHMPEEPIFYSAAHIMVKLYNMYNIV